MYNKPFYFNESNIYSCFNQDNVNVTNSYLFCKCNVLNPGAQYVLSFFTLGLCGYEYTRHNSPHEKAIEQLDTPLNSTEQSYIYYI